MCAAGELHEHAKRQILRTAPERNLVTFELAQIDECLGTGLKGHFHLERD